MILENSSDYRDFYFDFDFDNDNDNLNLSIMTLGTAAAAAAASSTSGLFTKFCSLNTAQGTSSGTGAEQIFVHASVVGYGDFQD
jgi:hypothetical protein